MPLETARANRTPIEWDGYQPPQPKLANEVTVLEDYPLAELRDYIDWQPFFNAWEMKGRFPDILNNPASGEAARKLYDDAQEMLDKIIDGGLAARERGLRALPGERRRRRHRGLHRRVAVARCARRCVSLRQQGEHRDGVPNRSLADFVAPQETGLADYVGGVRRHRRARQRGQGQGVQGAARRLLRDPRSSRSPTGSPRRSRSACTSGSARSSGATPRARSSTTTALLKEEYDGIRPAPGYPACPEHTEKATLWDLLDVEKNTGITLTESMAMWPGASVSGFYFSHPQSQYFVVGRIGKDQVEDYAARKGMTLAEAERWLSPNLGYEPED